MISPSNVHHSCDDSLAERSKAPDSSSGGAIRVGSNPTAVIFFRSDEIFFIFDEVDLDHSVL